MLDKIKSALGSRLNEWREQANMEEFQFVDCGGSPDPNADINIYVHGYAAMETPFDLKAVKGYIGEDKRHQSYLFYWPSGSVLRHIAQPKNLQLAYRLLKPANNLERLAVGVQGTIELFQHFKEHQIKSEHVGNSVLLQQVASFIQHRLKDSNRVNLIGHSLGARMILNALEDNVQLAKSLRINNVLLLAGAVADDKIHWDRVLEAIAGDVHNFYSSRDVVLMAKPDTERCVGRYPINTSPFGGKRIKSYNTKLQHWSYWKQIQPLLKQAELF